MNVKEIFSNEKNKKVVVVFGIFAISMISLMVYFAVNPKNQELKTQNNIIQIASPIDSTMIGGKKEVYTGTDSTHYDRDRNDEIIVGAVENNQNTENGDESEINRYLQERRASKNRLRTQSGRRRTYNSRGNSNDWSVVSTNDPIDYSPRERTLPSSSDENPFVNQNPIVASTPRIAPNQEIDYQEKEVLAEIISSGEVTNGRSITFVILEPFTLGKTKFLKGQSIVGRAKLAQNRLVMKFAYIKKGNKKIKVNAYLLGYDGERGLPINIGEDVEGSFGEEVAEEVATNEVRDRTSSIPVVGSVINALSRKKNKKNSIELTDNIQCSIIFRTKK